MKRFTVRQTLGTETNVRTYSKDKQLVNKRRRQIADEAVKEFWSKGFERTTMRDIAKACGMSAGTLYHYIGSKTDILHLICISYAPGADKLRRYLSTLGDVSQTERLRKCIAYYFQRVDSNSHVARFLNREGYRISRQDSVHVLDSEANIKLFFEQILREGIKTGEFQISNPALVACNILISAQTWVLRQPFLRRCFTFTLKQYTEEQVRVLLEAISTRNSPVEKTPAQISSHSGSEA